MASGIFLCLTGKYLPHIVHKWTLHKIKWKSFAEPHLEEGNQTIFQPCYGHCLPLVYALITMQGLHFYFPADASLASCLHWLSFRLTQTHFFFLIPCSWEECWCLSLLCGTQGKLGEAPSVSHCLSDIKITDSLEDLFAFVKITVYLSS